MGFSSKLTFDASPFLTAVKTDHGDDLPGADGLRGGDGLTGGTSCASPFVVSVGWWPFGSMAAPVGDGLCGLPSRFSVVSAAGGLPGSAPCRDSAQPLSATTLRISKASVRASRWGCRAKLDDAGNGYLDGNMDPRFARNGLMRLPSFQQRLGACQNLPRSLW